MRVHTPSKTRFTGLSRVEPLVLLFTIINFIGFLVTPYPARKVPQTFHSDDTSINLVSVVL